MKKIEKKKYLGGPTPPEDQPSFLFAGLLANPDMPRRHDSGRSSGVRLVFVW